MIQDHEIAAWLGPAAAELDEDQRDEFARLVRAYAETTTGRQGEPADYADEDTAAWIAALEQVEGTLDVAARGRAYRGAKDQAYAGAIIAALAGVSEVQAARDATITRRTLRQLLGKEG
jgi:hypothetical protein